MFVVLFTLYLYNTHAGIQIKRKATGPSPLAVDSEEGVINVDVDIANATDAPNTGYMITIPGGQRFWTYAIRANYICGRGMTYRYSNDVSYTTDNETDLAGVVLVAFIGVLITIAFCATWPMLLAINGKLRGLKKKINKIGDKMEGMQAVNMRIADKLGVDVEDVQHVEGEEEEGKKRCGVSSVFAYVWMCIAGVVVLFIGIVAAQLICSMMGWKNFYKKIVTNKCFYVDRSAIVEKDVPTNVSYSRLTKAEDSVVDVAIGHVSDEANIVDRAIVNYDDTTDTAVFLMGRGTSKFTTLDKNGKKVTYLFVAPIVEQGRIGDDNCSERVTTYKITGVDVENYMPNAYKKGTIIRQKCYDRQTLSGEKSMKCKKSVLGNYIPSSVNGKLAPGVERELLYDTGKEFDSKMYDPTGNEVLQFFSNRTAEDRKYGYCVTKGCVESRIYMTYTIDKNTWRICRRPPVQNITTPGSVTVFVDKEADSGTYARLPDDGWDTPITKTVGDTDEYYTNGVSIVEKDYSGYTKDNEYKVNTLLSLFKKKKKTVNVSVRFDYIDNTLFAFNSGEGGIYASIKGRSEIVGYLKDRAMDSLASTHDGIYSKIWRKAGDAASGIFATNTIFYALNGMESGLTTYTLRNASSYGVFVNRSCSRVHTYVDGGKTYVETDDEKRCLLTIVYDEVDTYITLSKGTPIEVTGASKWRCVTDSIDGSIGTSCGTPLAASTFAPSEAVEDVVFSPTITSTQTPPEAYTSSSTPIIQDNPANVGVIPLDILPKPLSVQDMKDAAGDTNISESNVGEVNNKSSSSVAVAIVVVVVVVVCVVCAIAGIVVFITRRKKKEGENEEDEISDIENDNKEYSEEEV